MKYLLRRRENKMKKALGMIFASALISVAFAQQPSGSEIKAREEKQQDRIANGVASGQLTAGETAKLEKQEAKIKGEVAKDRAANGGTLTAEEKKQINAQQNQLSNKIYSEKHDDSKQVYGNNEVDERRENQQKRIADGIASGKLTAGEAARLETQEGAINKEVRAERKANGGNLTNNQKAQVNKQLNGESTRIYRKKHNSAQAPK
jgi:hypothetical protein